MDRPVQRSRYRLSRLKLVGAYLAFATVWILLSDRAIEAVFSDAAVLSTVGSVKGMVFVVVTSLLLLILLARRDALIAASEHERSRESSARVALGKSLVRARSGSSPAEIAEILCDELVALPDIDIAEVIVFGQDDLAMPLAARTPLRASLLPTRPLPRARAAELRQRAALGPWIEQWRPRSEDGDLGMRFAEAGLKSIGYWPLRDEDRLLGVLAIGTTAQVSQDRVAERLVAVAEFATLANALLAPELSNNLRDTEQRALIRSIIETRRLRVVYQPICDLRTRIPIGFEALTRFDDGAPPAERFAAAQALGIGIELETATLAAALAGELTLPPEAWLSVNVSPMMIGHAAFGGLLARIGDRRSLVFEVTEHTAVDDYERIRRAMRRAGDRFRLAVDDAGAGYASMRHIVELQPAFVKIDQGLVCGIDEDAARAAMVAGIRYFAARVGCGLIAEGVETEGQVATLRRIGIRLGQGYLLGRPASAVQAALAPKPTARPQA